MNYSIDPKITIAISVFNGAPYLTDCIRSVINQTYKDWSLLLINDGSTDDSLSIMNEFAQLDKRIKVVNDGLNMGLVYRLNQSTSMSQTKYYARMDADDIMYYTRLESQFKYLEQHPEIDVLGTSIMTIDENNNIVGSGLSHGKVEGFIHPTVLGKTEWFISNPYQSWAIRAEDKELWLRAREYSNFYSLPQPLLFYREFGTFNLRKVLMSYKTELKIYARYQQYSKTFRWCIINTVRTIVKMVVYIISSSLGLSGMIIKLRKRQSIDKKSRLTQADLQKSIKI